MLHNISSFVSIFLSFCFFDFKHNLTIEFTQLKRKEESQEKRSRRRRRKRIEYSQVMLTNKEKHILCTYMNGTIEHTKTNQSCAHTTVRKKNIYRNSVTGSKKKKKGEKKKNIFFYT